MDAPRISGQVVQKVLDKSNAKYVPSISSCATKQFLLKNLLAFVLPTRMPNVPPLHILALICPSPSLCLKLFPRLSGDRQCDLKFAVRDENDNAVCVAEFLFYEFPYTL